MCPFPENYVPPVIINKLTLNEPAINQDFDNCGFMLIVIV